MHHVLLRIKQKVKENIPDWLFAIIQMFYWAAHPRCPFIKLFPSNGCWVSIWKGERLYVPSPRTAVLGHFLQSYKRVYGRYFWVEENEVVLDIGAYVGSFTLAVSGKARNVLSIEPDPKSFACLQLNVSRFSNVQVVRKGIWNSKKRLKLFLDPQCPIANSVVIPSGNIYIDVDGDTLDNITEEYGFNKVDFIKMNVEGAELEALQGAERVLRSAKKIVIDAHHVRDGGSTWPFVCQFLKASGFETCIAEETETVYAWKKDVVT